LVARDGMLSPMLEFLNGILLRPFHGSFASFIRRLILAISSTHRARSRCSSVRISACGQ
jgi:hypothetical protein